MSPFRPELDLSAILTSYNKHLDPKSEPETPVHQSFEDEDGYRYAFPVKVGAWASEVCTTCVEIAVPIVLKWDVNGYYRALKVSPDATRRELMQAYMEANGQDSPWLTYCFKQLLNVQVRAAYDATPLGESFLDEYTQAQLRQDAARSAMQRTQTGQAITAEEVLDEWGYEVHSEADGVAEETGPSKALHHKTSTRPFDYGFYAWKTKKTYQDEGRMADWQSTLVSEAVKLGIIIEIAIGTTASADGGTLIERDVKNRPIIYLDEQAEITEKLAKDALLQAVAV